MRRPKYVPPSKETKKVPANLDEFNDIITTPSLPKAILVENIVVGRVATFKFEDYDLANRTKFPHLAMDALMDHKIDGAVTAL